MRQSLLSRYPTYAVWALVGLGAVTFLWTVLALGRPDMLENHMVGWLRPGYAELRPSFGELPLEMRKSLARRLLSLQLDISAHNDSKVPSGKWVSEIDAMAAALDPRVDRGNLKASTMTCPERHDGTKFVRKSCHFAPKTSEILSVILPARGWSPERVMQVLEGFNHKMKVILILDDDVPPPETNVTVLLTYNDNVSEGRALNEAVLTVETPFVLVGNNLDFFSDIHASLSRLIQVMDRQPSVGVVGGGYRDVHGQWRYGCIQRSITNYHATFIHGYEYSRQECMYCDDIIGPFVANTHLLKEEPFNEILSESVIYHDWFTVISHAGYLAMVCPDAMFFVQEEPIMQESEWREYARQWAVVSIDAYDRKRYKFSCSEVHLNCNDLQKRISWYLIPPCCREMIMQGITFVDKFAREKGIDYEMHHGSLLGAIKLGSYLPWDFDQDIYYDCRDKNVWKSMNSFLKENKASCHLRLSNTQTQLVIQCKTFFIDMVCRKPLSRFTLPEIYSNTSTWIDYGGHRVVVMANPGAAARDQGGHENLRHAQHWRVRNHPDAGAWRPCRSFHLSCLDRHPGDGNFAFRNPPACLP